MASELAAYYVSIVPSAKGLAGKIGKEFAGVDREASKAGKSSGRAFAGAFKAPLAGIAGAFAAVGIGSFVKDAVTAAGDIEQSFGALDSVFKGSSKDMRNWSRNAARDVGLTSNEFNELGTLIGAQLKNGGTAMEELAPKTKNLIGLGSDLSSMFGGTTKDAVDALSSALKGERDPIERYGVSLNQAKIDAEAAALGFEKVEGALSSEATQAATLSLIMKQTTDAHGNFAKESDTFAHKQQVMAAEWGNLTTKMGELFLPTITSVFSFISDKVLPALGEGVGGVRAFGAAFKAADGDITSNGFPGFMERMAAGAIGLRDLLVKGDYRGLLRTAFGWEEDSPIVGFVLDLRDGVIGAKDALVDAGGWVVKNSDWLLTLAVSVGSVIAAYKTYTIALATHSAVVAIYTAATTAAGAAQGIFAGAAWTAALGVTALNTALKANLFGIIALAVIGLASGLTYFFTQTEAGRAIVARAWEGIQKVVGGVVDWFTGTALPAIQEFADGVAGFFEGLGRAAAPALDGVKSGADSVVSFFEGAVAPAFQSVFAGIGAVFTWLHQTIVVPWVAGIQQAVGFVVSVFEGIRAFLQPAFDSVGVILNGFYLGARGVFQLVSSVIQYLLVPMFEFFWGRVVDAFTGIGEAVSKWWEIARIVFDVAVSFIRGVFAGAFQWVSVRIQAVFAFIGALISMWWKNAQAVFNAVGWYFRNVLSPLFTWLWNGVVKPVFDGIGAVVFFWWNSKVLPVFRAVQNFINNVLGPVFNWLWRSVVKPVWDGIGLAIATVWNAKVKPVFDALNKFIKETIPAAFKFGVALAEKHWKTLGDIAKAPVRFVVDTVINDGLIGAFNTIAGFLPGIDKLPRVALPRGFANGGYTGDGGKYQPAGIVHAGEYVFTKEQTRRAGVGNLAALAGSLTGYAKGGVVNPLKQMALTQGYNRVHKGIDLAAAVGTPVYATQNGVVTHSGPGASAPGVWGGQEIHVLGNGIETWFAHLSQIGVKLGQNVKAGQQIGLSGNTGISTGPHLHFGVFNGGWPNDINPLSYLGGAGVPDGKPWNPIADIVGGLVDQFKKSFPAAGFIADLAIGAGKKILDGAVAFVTGQSGKDQGNVTTYDGGGWLRNTGGTQLVQHNKRKPDAVLSNEQWSTMSRIAENSALTSRAGVTFTGDVHVRDENELARIIQTKQMDALAVYV